MKGILEPKMAQEEHIDQFDPHPATKNIGMLYMAKYKDYAVSAFDSHAE